MEFIPQSNEVIQQKLESIIGKPKQNKLKLIRSYGLRGVIIGLFILVLGIGWTIVGNNKKNDVISQILDNQNTNDDSNNQGQKFGLAKLIEKQLQTVQNLPRENNGEEIKIEVYTIFSGNIARKGLGYGGRINDGTAKRQLESEFQKSFLSKSNPDSKLIALNSSDKIISESNITYLQNNIPVQSDQGDWIAAIRMPIGTARLELTKSGVKLDTIYVDNRVPRILINNFPQQINPERKPYLSVQTDELFDMYRLDVELFDVIRRKSYTLMSGVSINSSTFERELDLSKFGISQESKYYLQVSIATPFVVNSEKSNEFTYRDR